MSTQLLSIPEEKPRFPFSMVEKMMPLYSYLAVMGWALVLLAFLVGLFGLSPALATFFADAKAVRESAVAGSPFVSANVTVHVIEAWLPQVKFFGLGLGLLSIVMALGLIAKSLRTMGYTLTGHIAADRRPAMPKQPKTVRVFQMSAMMGVMVLMAAVIIGVGLATTVVPAYWNHSIANELNPAQPGSTLLAQAALVKSFALWLNPLRMVGMSLLFTAITLALVVIVGTLKLQANLLIDFYHREISRA